MTSRNLQLRGDPHSDGFSETRDAMEDNEQEIGLYDARFEHDACGVAFVADLERPASHEIVDLGLTALENLAHRGAFGADPETGDGAGILIQMPDAFFRAVVSFPLPAPGRYISGMAFLPFEARAASGVTLRDRPPRCRGGLLVAGWREVPIDLSQAGLAAMEVAPRFEQLFLVADPLGPAAQASGIELDRVAFVVQQARRTRAERHLLPVAVDADLCLQGHALDRAASTLLPRSRRCAHRERLGARALALFYEHLPVLAARAPVPDDRPQRRDQHRAGQPELDALTRVDARDPLIPGDLRRISPILTARRQSDSASFDEVVELLHLGGRSLPHAILMMIPEAWENHTEMDQARKAFYRFHGCLMEPWDGPAAVAFTDGEVIGAVLDRNGLRPARYWVRDDGLVVLASEVGVLDIDPARIVRKGRLQPGRMFLCDTTAGRIIDDAEVKAELAAAEPYGEWLEANLLNINDLPIKDRLVPQHGSLAGQQRLFGYTYEELRIILGPMARAGAEPTGSMGSDTPIAVLSERSRLLFDYFTQLFSQVTNPPLDAIREELVTSIKATIGPSRNLLEASAEACRQITLDFPVIENHDLAKLLYVNEDGETPGFKAFAIDGLYEVAGGGKALRAALDKVCLDVETAILDGANIVVLSDRHASAELAPIPSLLLTSAVHHHLVRERLRSMTGLIIETGEAREVHHMALLIGFGAAAINPYLAVETVAELARRGELGSTSEYAAVHNYVKAAGKGVLKVMSKMGISTIASYTGAQVFEAVGLSREVVDRYFTGVISHLGGADLDVIAQEVAMRHTFAFSTNSAELANREIEVGGEYQWRREGEHHLFNPKTVFKLQHATRAKRYEIFKEYTTLVDEQAERLATLRGLLRFKIGECRRGPCDSDRGGGTGRGDRAPLRDGGDVVRLDLSRGARDARDRDEPPGREIQHRRGRRGPGALRPRRERRFPQIGDQAGRLRQIRRHEQLPRECRRHPDQDGPGRKARRGRTAAWREGLALDRPHSLLDTRRRADLATATSRHLLHRGSGSAHPRPEEREQLGSHPREARGRGRRRHRRGRRREGARRRGPHLRPRRRHRGRAAHVVEARGLAVGDRPRRDPADAREERTARQDRRAGRRPAEDRARRRRGSAPRRRGVRLRDRAARRVGLCDDARLPPRHLSRRDRDPEPRAASTL